MEPGHVQAGLLGFSERRLRDSENAELGLASHAARFGLDPWAVLDEPDDMKISIFEECVRRATIIEGEAREDLAIRIANAVGQMLKGGS